MEERIHDTILEERRLNPKQLVLLTLAIIVLSSWLLLTPGGLMGKADAIGYAVCHRIETHSFHLGDRTLPLCSRCTGMYIGALTTLVAFVALRGKSGAYPTRSIQYALIVFAVLWMLDGLNSFLSVFPDIQQLYPSQNWLRLVTGTLIGVSLISMIYPIFVQTAWRTWEPSSILPSWRWFIGLLGALGLIILGILSENPMILYPLAILSSIGVIALLTLAYSVLMLTFFKRQNRIVSMRQLWYPLLGGLTLALAQIAVIDLIRYVVTGTWDGFHL
jgi:uncharacterized membrane protein